MTRLAFSGEIRSVVGEHGTPVAEVVSAADIDARCESRLDRCDDDEVSPGAALTRPDPWVNSDRATSHYATKANVASLRTWMEGLLQWLG